MSAATNFRKMFAMGLMPPPPARSYMEFARSMTLPDGPSKGLPWDPATEPAQRIMVNAMDSGKYRIFVVVAPSQRGKTLSGILMPTLHSLLERRTMVGYVMPNLDKLAQNWDTKIKPAIENGGYGNVLPSKGPGSKGGRPAVLGVLDPRTGMRVADLVFMAMGLGNRETAVSSVSPQVIVIDEADDALSVGQIALTMRRIESWGKEGMAFIASTVNRNPERPGHPILEMYERGTKCRLAHQCPHCNNRFVPDQAHFDVHHASIICPHCTVKWSESDRHEALNHALPLMDGQTIQGPDIVGDPTSNEMFSIITTGLDFHMADLGIMAAEWKAAKEAEDRGNPALMETHRNKVWCRDYVRPMPKDALTAMTLAIRSSKSAHNQGVIPEDADRVVVAVDVQMDRLYWMAIAAGTDDRIWIVDADEWYFLPFDANGRKQEPTADDLTLCLDRVRVRAMEGWPRENGSLVPASLMGVDIGFNTKTVGGWCYGKAGVIPVRGEEAENATVYAIDGSKKGYQRISQQGPKQGSNLVKDHGLFEIREQPLAAPGQPLHWWFVRTQAVREHVASRWRREVESKGSLMLWRGLAADTKLLRHLTAWTIELDPETEVTKWVQKHRRDDWLDCLCYGIAISATRIAPPVPEAPISIPHVAPSPSGYQRRTSFERRHA